MGEAKGDSKKTIEYYEKSIKLNHNNEKGKEMIRERVCKKAIILYAIKRNNAAENN